VALNALHEQDITFGANLRRRAPIFVANVEKPGVADRMKSKAALLPVKCRPALSFALAPALREGNDDKLCLNNKERS